MQNLVELNLDAEDAIRLNEAVEKGATIIAEQEHGLVDFWRVLSDRYVGKLTGTYILSDNSQKYTKLVFENTQWFPPRV